MMASIRIPGPVYLPELVVTQHGMPLGTTRAYLTSGALIVGELRVDPAYVAIRDLLRRASASLWAVGFLAEMPGVPHSNAPVDAVTRAAELPPVLLCAAAPNGQTVRSRVRNRRARQQKAP